MVTKHNHRHFQVLQVVMFYLVMSRAELGLLSTLFGCYGKPYEATTQFFYNFHIYIQKRMLCGALNDSLIYPSILRVTKVCFLREAI